MTKRYLYQGQPCEVLHICKPTGETEYAWIVTPVDRNRWIVTPVDRNRPASGKISFIVPRSQLVEAPVDFMSGAHYHHNDDRSRHFTCIAKNKNVAVGWIWYGARDASVDDKVAWTVNIKTQANIWEICDCD